MTKRASKSTIARSGGAVLRDRGGIAPTALLPNHYVTAPSLTTIHYVAGLQWSHVMTFAQHELSDILEDEK